MPQKKLDLQGLDLGQYFRMTQLFHDYVTFYIPKAKANGLNDDLTTKLSSFDYKKWTKDDLILLSESYNGVESFDTLIALKNVVGGLDSKATEEDKIHAQNALTVLKPNSCKSWKSFYNMIADVQEETESKHLEQKAIKEAKKRRGQRTGAVLENLSPDIGLNQVENPNFDPKEAFQNKDIKVADAASGEKQPMETAVTDAIKGLPKGMIRAA